MSTDGTFNVSQIERNKVAGLIAVRSIRTLATHIVDIADSARAIRRNLQIPISITSDAFRERGAACFTDRWDEPITTDTGCRTGKVDTDAPRFESYRSYGSFLVLNTPWRPNRAGNRTLPKIANGGIGGFSLLSRSNMWVFACKPISRMVRGFMKTMARQFGMQLGRSVDGSEEGPFIGSILRLLESLTRFRNVKCELRNEGRVFEGSGTRRFGRTIGRLFGSSCPLRDREWGTKIVRRFESSRVHVDCGMRIGE